MNALLAELYRSILLCRPKSIHKFSVRFLQDSKSSTPDEAHALHFLPFLVHHPEQFQRYASTVYYACMNGKLCNNNGLNSNGDSAKGSNDVAASSSSSIVFREYLDGPMVFEVIQAMDLPSLGLQHAAIDEMVAEKLDYLKQVDFKLFITLLRLVLSLYHLNIWIRDEVSDFFRNFPSSVTALPSFPLPGDCPVDTSKLRAYLQRKSRETPEYTNTTSYHLHAVVLTTELHAALMKVLYSIIEEERGQVIALDTLVDKLVRKYLQVQAP